MTKQKEFVISKLKEFSKENFGVKLSYVYDSEYEQHIIEVIPESIYNSEEFSNKQIELENQLIDKFPEIDIFFVTENHGLDIPKFEFVVGEIKKENSDLNYINLGIMGWYEHFENQILRNPIDISNQELKINIGAIDAMWLPNGIISRPLISLEEFANGSTFNSLREINANIHVFTTGDIANYPANKTSYSFQEPTEEYYIRPLSKELKLKGGAKAVTLTPHASTEHTDKQFWSTAFISVRIDEQNGISEENSNAMAA